MSAGKTLAVTLMAWSVFRALSAHADPVSISKSDQLWMRFWPTGAVTAYVASTAPASNNSVSNAAPVSTTVTEPLLAVPTASPVVSTPAVSAPVATVPAVAAPIMATAQPEITAAPTASVPQSLSNASTAAAPVDAFINMTNGPFPESSNLTTGGTQPWYQSPSVVKAFGGVPNAQQQASFTQTVLQDVQHTFQLSGMNPTLTTDPNVPALHTISVVSGASYSANSAAIGITDVGNNGFSFIDKLDYATNPTDLAWAEAHNISHELMHAFGIGYHPDGGNYVDAASASWATLIDPNTQFGPAATQLLLSSQYGTISSGSTGSGLGAELLNPEGTKIDGDETLPQPIPEPATMALWAFGAFAGMMVIRRQKGRPFHGI